MRALTPSDETQRLESLRRYHLLDTASEEIFDGLTRLISTICGTPMALISLVDSGRQWFKSEHGLGVSETTREESICAHAILQPGLFIVPDTQKDVRFADNPLVLAKNGLRFYAGAPLKSSDGYALGTLCVLDRVPRVLNDSQKDALNTLADTVMALLELRRTRYEEMKVAHDFMNLATGIQGVTGAMLEDSSLTEAQREDLQAVWRAADRSVQLTRQLKSAKAEPQGPTTIDVNRVVDSSSQMVRRFLRSDIRLTTRLSPHRPHVLMNPTPFEQVLMNLLMNARDAIDDAGHITITTEVKGEMLHVFVQDTGQGIPSDQVSRIFDRFYTTKKEGTGLGLAMVQEIVQHHGGTIRVDSTVGVGTTFEVTLPLAPSAIPAAVS